MSDVSGQRQGREDRLRVRRQERPSASALRTVVPPWAASRLLVLVVALLAVATGPGRPARALSGWDGAWYADIAREGYGFSHGGKTPHPFFPLLPLALRLGSTVGLPPWLAGVLLSNAALLVGLLGLHRLVSRRFGDGPARLAVWALAFFPGAAPLSMVYPEATMLALATWTFAFAEEGRTGVAGVLAALAAFARPNGAAVAISLAGGFALERDPVSAARVALPAAAAVLAWMAFLGWTTGDPLAFVHAKAAWAETTIGGVLAGRDTLPKLDLGVFAVAAATLLAAARRLPASWLGFAALWILPSLFLGILGMPRYVSACFPVFAAVGLLLAGAPRAIDGALLATGASGLAFLAWRIASGRMIP
ncbi:MAG: hypothetical protein ACKOCT_05240 [Alphaproteobacteria bacterium]